MRGHPPRVAPGRRRYPAAVADGPATVADPATVDHESATGEDTQATGNDPPTGDDEAAPIASDHATDEAATGGRSRGRSSAA